MRRLGRRRFIGGAAAAVCVGCRDGGSADERASSATTAPGDVGVSTSVGRDDLPGLTSQVLVGGLDDTLAAAVDAPLYVPEARAHLVSLDPADAADLADASDDRLRPGLDHGLLALYQKCPHLGCRVPYCETSGWFECMCHGTMFTPTGEHRDGPSPRGMDAFVVVVDDAGVSIDTGELVTGAALGSAIVDRPPNGPHCVTAAGDR